MMSLKSLLLISSTIAVIACVCAQLAPGSNMYLPPKPNGYNYPEPKNPLRPGTPSGPGPRPPGPQRPSQPGPGEPGHVHVPGMPFDFEYAVNDVETANDYAHKASSNGDVVTGEYRVALPDGRTQIVRYTADWKTGYHADVSYEGEPQFPQGPGGRPGYKY
ncbi:pro-resilin [Bactrocera neohumeralis]|uniref:pro-resilin n=1 Tax=Bactrocera neohumeralis TaxID=98809 RepID=UPI0021652B01|nr:pro-resilin [Bactrocera neohumeralis]